MNIPGPGSAMAYAVLVAIYSSAFAIEISDSFRFILLFMAVILLLGTYKIEQLHVEKEIIIKKLCLEKEKNTNELPPTVQDEKEEHGEVKLIQPDNFMFTIFIVMLSTSMGIFGSILASYTYDGLVVNSPVLGYYNVIFILLVLIFFLSYLAFFKKSSKTKTLMDESEKRGKQDTDES